MNMKRANGHRPPRREQHEHDAFDHGDRLDFVQDLMVVLDDLVVALESLIVLLRNFRSVLCGLGHLDCLWIHMRRG